MTKKKNIVIPEPLMPGDTIAICSPAGAINPEKVLEARDVLEARGWNVRIMPHAMGQYGNYSGSAAQRFDDMRNALTDPSVRAVICSRGGYGVVHIMERLDEIDLLKDPKWIVGFSDISAIHALCTKQGIASIHGSMCSHLANGTEDPENMMLFDILEGNAPAYTIDACPRYDRPGVAQGRLVGGNLAVLAHLAGTSFDVFEPGTILFVEDVSEPIYKIERMFYQLRMSGVLPNLAGLVVGQFTEYSPDKSYSVMEDMIADMVAPYRYPVAFNVPIGHVSNNIPVIENAQVTLKVTGTPTNSLIFWPLDQS